MVQFRNEIDIDVPLDFAFDELSDQRHEMRWSPKMRAVELISSEPIRVGSRLRARWTGTPSNDVVYTAFERPNRWAMRFTSWLMVADTAHELSRGARGTHLTSTWDMRLRGLLQPLSGLVARGIRTDVADSIRRAKAHVEDLYERSATSAQTSAPR